jgi:hypothetical protein
MPDDKLPSPNIEPKPPNEIDPGDLPIADALTKAKAEEEDATKAKRKEEAEARQKKLEEEAEKAEAQAKRAEERAVKAQDDYLEAAKEATRLEDEARKSGDKAKMEEAKAKRSEANAMYRESKKRWEAAEKAAEKAERKSLHVFAEPQWQELLDLTDQDYIPLEVGKTRGDAYAQHVFDPATGKERVVLSTEFAKELKSNGFMEHYDGGGECIDRKTLKPLQVTSKERMQITLAHELAHSKHSNHGPEFQKLMYDYICKLVPDYPNRLYLWSPPSRDYSPWPDRPNMITKARLKEMQDERET